MGWKALWSGNAHSLGTSVLKSTCLQLAAYHPPRTHRIPIAILTVDLPGLMGEVRPACQLPAFRVGALGNKDLKE